MMVRETRWNSIFLAMKRQNGPLQAAQEKKKIIFHCNLFQKLNMISFRLAETISRLRNIFNVSQFC